MAIVLMVSAAAAAALAACTESKCYFDCVFVPPGCHVEGANSSTDCSKASCGTVVCPADAGDFSDVAVADVLEESTTPTADAPGDTSNGRCTPGQDSTCNDNPAISSIHGRCLPDGSCTCLAGFPAVNQATGKCP
jgi:hypothetical protein